MVMVGFVEDILQTITDVKRACERYEGVRNHVMQEVVATATATASASIRGPTPAASGVPACNWATWDTGKKIAWLCDILLAQECTSSVPLFEFTTEAATKLYQVIRSGLTTLCGQQQQQQKQGQGQQQQQQQGQQGQQQQQKKPTGGSGSTTTTTLRSSAMALKALKVAMERCQLALLSLQKVKYTAGSRLSDTAYQSALINFGIEDTTATLIGCKGKTLLALFSYLTGTFNTVRPTVRDNTRSNPQVHNPEAEARPTVRDDIRSNPQVHNPEAEARPTVRDGIRSNPQVHNLEPDAGTGTGAATATATATGAGAATATGTGAATATATVLEDNAMAERNTTIYMAKLASQFRRDNDFRESIRAACMADANLSAEERDLLVKGYDKAVWNLREELGDSLSSHLKQKQNLNAQQLEAATKYQTKVEDELIKTCNDFIDLIDHYLLPGAHDAESRVFYKRMKGQQYFYMARTKAGNERQQFAEKSRIEYEEALQIASKMLSPANAERLRLECSRCLLYYKIFNEEQRARAWAKTAFQTAVTERPHECTAEGPAYRAFVDLVKFSEGIDDQFFKDEVRKIPMEDGQEGGSERKRRRIN